MRRTPSTAPPSPEMAKVAVESRGGVRRVYHSFDSHEPMEVVLEDRHRVRTTALRTSFFSVFMTLFLPEGYPESVSCDYASYQTWDTLQALCSSITGTLATRCVFKGVGVGEVVATTGAATLTWIMRNVTGMVGRISFASLKSSQLDSDCKRWRLAADLTNDMAIFLEILSATVDKYFFLAIICLASLCQAVTGVAGGATRASLTQHFAIAQNMADVSAKDGSQETAVGLIGMLAGSLITVMMPEDSDYITSTWVLFLIFTALHLLCNYRGVSAVVLADVNRYRLERCLQAFRTGHPLTPAQVARTEPIIMYRTLPGISLGCSLKNMATTAEEVAQLRRTFPIDKYWLTHTNGKVMIALTADATGTDQILAYMHAYYIIELKLSFSEAHKAVQREGEEFIKTLEKSGWNLNRVLLNPGAYRLESFTD
eukprot:Sspe_Gene.69505::Locus_40978_Transcript_2_2_Confidence_0.500_Length_1457::g.69505::m.69505